MRHIAHSTFGIRLALLTTFISVAAVIIPLVALAGNGDPTGT
jgi:hypothetical protein